jgi:hypothetical protein
MFIARKNIATGLWGFPGRALASVRDFIYGEKKEYCERVLRPQIEKARLIRESGDPDRLDIAANFGAIVSGLELAVYRNMADAPLAAEILRDIAEQETRFRIRYGRRANFMRSSYQEEIIRGLLAAGDHAAEKSERLLK